MRPAVERFMRIMARHVLDEDQILEDVPAVKAAVERWKKSLAEPIIDVSE